MKRKQITIHLYSQSSEPTWLENETALLMYIKNTIDTFRAHNYGAQGAVLVEDVAEDQPFDPPVGNPL